MKFAIDAFGGDNAPEAVIRGSIDAMQLNDDFSIIFTGDESAIYALLNNYEYDKSRVEVVHAPDVITCEDQPTLAVRRKKESSIGWSCRKPQCIKERNRSDSNRKIK